MALQESFTRARDGVKFVLRQSSEGRWSVKCLIPPDADTKQWDVAWEVDSTKITGLGPVPVKGGPNPLTEQQARATYESYMG